MWSNGGRGGICLTSFNSPTPKTPCYVQESRWYLHTNRVIAYFASNFVAMATGVGRGRICLMSFNSPTLITPDRRKNLGDISYTSWVIVDFVPNFVAMATVVDRCGWFLTSFNSPSAQPRKPPATCKNLGDISRTSWVIAYFVSNFAAMATGVARGRIYLTSFNSPTPKIHW